MRQIELTQEQKNMVLDELAEQQGVFDFWLPIGDDINIHAWGLLDIYGYRESDNGGFNETGRIADVSIEAFVGEDEEEVELGHEFETECWAALQAA